jgi:hypothetical protein
MSENEEDEDKVYRVKNEKPLRKPLAYSHVVSSSTHSLLLFHHGPVVQHSFHGLKKNNKNESSWINNLFFPLFSSFHCVVIFTFDAVPNDSCFLVPVGGI